MKFTEIQVQGYRSIVDVSLPLRPLAVMIGPNGSGKTALLEVFLLLNRAAWSNLAKALEGYGGLDAVLSKVPGAPSSLKIGLTVDVESERSREPMHYCFELVPHERPPSRRLDELCRVARPPRKYVKPIEMAAILRNQDLTVAAAQCPELKSLLNTLLSLADLTLLS